MEKTYCELCGNVGTLPSGEQCTCPAGRGEDYAGVVTCLTVPEQYRGLPFDEDLITSEGVGDYYRSFLRKTYDSIRTMKLRNTNLFIASPPKKGKTVFAYAVIEHLFRKGIETFPIFDAGELHSIMKAVDAGKAPVLLEGIEARPINIYTAPYLFVKIPQELGYNVFDTIAQIVDRRTRRNNSTIFLSHLSWNYLVKADQKGVLQNLVGDGSFGTLDNKSFFSGGSD